MYVVVRADLPLAQQAVQAIHAGIFSARELFPPDIVHPSLVLCTVPDQSALLALLGRCNQAGIRSRLFVEADLGHQPTALATEPVPRQLRKFFRALPLFKV